MNGGTIYKGIVHEEETLLSVPWPDKISGIHGAHLNEAGYN